MLFANLTLRNIKIRSRQPDELLEGLDGLRGGWSRLGVKAFSELTCPVIAAAFEHLSISSYLDNIPYMKLKFPIDETKKSRIEV